MHSEFHMYLDKETTVIFDDLISKGVNMSSLLSVLLKKYWNSEAITHGLNTNGAEAKRIQAEEIANYAKHLKESGERARQKEIEEQNLLNIGDKHD